MVYSTVTSKTVSPTHFANNTNFVAKQQMSNTDFRGILYSATLKSDLIPTGVERDRLDANLPPVFYIASLVRLNLIIAHVRTVIAPSLHLLNLHLHPVLVIPQRHP